LLLRATSFSKAKRPSNVAGGPRGCYSF